MSDADKPVEKEVVVVRKKQKMFDDPVNRVLGVIIAALIIWSLGTILMLILTGVINLSGAPQNADDAAVLKYGSALDAEADSWQWQFYVVTLIESGRLAEAEAVINSEDFQNIDVYQHQEILYCTALLEFRRGNYEEAIALYRQVIEKTRESYEHMLETGGEHMNWALAEGISPNYSFALRDLTGAYMALEEWESALETVSHYLEINPQEAGMLIDRAHIKEQLGDYAGAIADLEMAQVFLPEDEEVIESIQRVEGKLQ
ncbi:MAG: tetratricopeptide repeat protein [Coriobacteriia bacterium]|nr:tetratricopeptide repeat protein [Coriobacteriia bacterium]